MPKNPATLPPEPTRPDESPPSPAPAALTGPASSRPNPRPGPSADATHDAFDGLVNIRRGPVVRRPDKTRITIHTNTVEAFRPRAQGTGRGCQTAINDTLRECLAAETLETTLRRVLREELARAEVLPLPKRQHYG